MNSKHTAENIGTNCDKRIDKLMGHWLYVRRCERPNPREGLVLPDWTKSESLWNEVLAIGTEVGKPRNWDEDLLEERGVAWCMCDYYRVGDILLVPEDMPSWAIKHSPFATDEFFIDESAFICGVVGDSDDRINGRLSDATEERDPA